MRIPELFDQKRPVFSMEIFPPKKKANIESIYDTVEKITVCKPDFISVTYGAGGSMTDNYTCEIASNIKKKFGIETLAHLTCINSSREDVKEMIGRFQDADIKNILTLRGDIAEDCDIKKDFHHANELAIEVQRKCSDDLEILGAYIPSYERTELTDKLHEKSGFRTDYEFISKAKMRSIIRETKHSTSTKTKK